MAKKYYAVRVGRNIGVYLNWSEAEKQVKGFKGAEYKSFTNEQEANDYINKFNTQLETTALEQGDENLHTNLNTIDAYVDGSYDAVKRMYSYGIVLVKNGEIIEKHWLSDDDERYVESFQIAGEVFGALKAIELAKAQKYEMITIYYDYMGIEKWATREWKAKKNVSTDYILLFDQVSNGIKVNFQKVKAHSGNEFNEIVDQLAKRALHEKGVTKNNDGSLTLSGIESGELELVLEVIQEEVDGIKYYNNSQENCLSHTLVSNNDKVVINSYNSGKITIQGKQSSFKEYVIILLVQLCEGEQEVIEVLNGYHEVKMDSDDIDKLFNQLMPNYVRGQKKLSKLDNVLYKAVYNYNLKDDQIRDYSDLPMPMLGALEYYLHTTFKSVSLLTVNSRDVNQFGCYFEKLPNGVFILQNAHAQKFPRIEHAQYLNDLYNFYFNNRHTLVHWNLDIEDTRILETSEESRELIKEGLTIIDNYYIMFNSEV